MDEFEPQSVRSRSAFARAPVWPALVMVLAVVVAGVWFVVRFTGIDPRAAIPPPTFAFPTGTSTSGGQSPDIPSIPPTPAETTGITPGSTATTRPDSGPTQVAVPDTVGQDYADATRNLQRAGLSSRRENVPSDEPEGMVVDQTPRTGTVEPGSVVILKVSTGQAATFPMPDLVGMTASEAERTLRDQHQWTGRFNITDVETDDPSTVGTIIEQRLAPGQECARDAQVDLLVATRLGTARSIGPTTTR